MRTGDKMNFLKTSFVVVIATLSFSGCSAIQNFREKLREDPVVLGGPVIDDDTFMLKFQDDSLLPSAYLMR